MNKLVKTIPEERLSTEFLRSLNGIVGLTERELQVFAALLDLHLANPKRLDHIDSPQNRRKVMAKCNVSRENLSRYLKLYRDKGFIAADKETGLMHLNKALIPNIIGDRVQIVMILKLNQDVDKKQSLVAA